MKFFRLLKNEYLRILCNYKIMLVLLLFFIGNSILLFFHAERDKVSPSAYKELKGTIATMSYEDGEAWIMDRYYGGEETEELKQLAKEYELVYSYPFYLQKIQDEADENVTISIFSKSEFARNNIQTTAKDFKKLEGTEIHCVGGYGISFVLSYYGTDIILFIIIALLIAAVLLEDKKSGMLSMMRATRFGGMSFALAKSIVVFTISFILTFLFKLVNILEAVHMYGNVSFDSSLQSLPGYDKCSYEWTIGQGVFISILISCLAFAFVSLLMFLFAAVSENYVVYYLAVLLFFSFEYGLFYIGDRIGRLELLKRFNILSLIDTNTCLSYYNYNFFNKPVHMLSANLTGILLLLFVCLFLGLLGFAKRSYDYKEIKLRSGRKRIKPGYGLWKNEAYKLFIGNKVLVLLVALLILQIYLYKDKTAHWYTDEINYRYYVNQIAGDVTDEKYEYMDEERERLAEIRNEYEMYEELFNNGGISEKDYHTKTAVLEIELKKENGFKMADTYASYIKELDEAEKGFVYDRGWNYLAGDKDYRNDTYNGIILMLFLILALSGVMTQEDRHHMNALIDTSYRRKSSKATKILLSILLISLIYLMVYLPELLWVIKEYGISGGGYSLHSIPLLSDVRLSCSLFSYYVIVNLIRYLTALIIGMVIVFSGKLIKNHNIIIAAIVIFVMPLLLRVMGIEVIDHFSFNRFVSGNMLFQK